jgi:hypothetical protein
MNILSAECLLIVYRKSAKSLFSISFVRAWSAAHNRKHMNTNT